MSARAEYDLAGGVVEQAAVACADAFGLGFGELPLLVDRARGVVEGLENASRATSGQAWCEWPESSSRSPTRKWR